jgi:hypothetical protein
MSKSSLLMKMKINIFNKTDRLGWDFMKAFLQTLFSKRSANCHHMKLCSYLS